MPYNCIFICLEPPVIQCQTPLGIESGNISDAAMMSSTILNASSLPHFGRLRNQLGDCAWIPATAADNQSSWLQVDLGSLIKMSAVATQGSCSGDQWTESFVITYSKNGEDWKHYGELGTIKVGIHKKNKRSRIHFLLSYMPLLFILLGLHW